ncbi:MAG: M4 family metallopeptidase [Bdellovibrionales bacterium]|nr:M4 family metallopeptidase [Bdellovibrionales bacterium]
MQSPLRSPSPGLTILSLLTALGSAASVFAQEPALAPPGANAFAEALAGQAGFDRLGSALRDLRAQPALARQLQGGTLALAISQRAALPEVETTKFQAYYRGVEVLGGTVLHHRLSATGASTVEDLVGRFDLEVRPTLTPEAAAALARETAVEALASLGARGEAQITAAPGLRVLPAPEGAARLIYAVGVEAAENEVGAEAPAEILVDAHSGEIVAELPRMIAIAAPRVQVRSAATAPQTVDGSGSPTWVDMSRLVTVVKNGATLPGADASARRASANAQLALAYYQRVHRRNSFDAQGSDAVSVVHWGRRMANAAWDPSKKMMFYGDGDGIETGDFTLSRDVAGHEFTHAVTSQAVKSGSARGFVYMGESGALDEATADIFGKLMVNDGSWVMGRDLFLQKDGATVGIRDIGRPGSMSAAYRDPASGQIVERAYPAHMRERFPSSGSCNASNDRCWVHVNSTVWSHGAYRVIQAVGRATAERLYYATLTQMLTPTSDFRRAKDATLRMCGMLYSSATCGKVRAALAQVGL